MIDAGTELYGVIGNPVRHSLSPVIHNNAFKRMRLNAAYLAFEVERLEEAIRGIKGLRLRGISVTIPFKTRVVPFLDEIETVAEKIGAVNTIVNEGGRLVGHNTDWRAALEILEEKVDLKKKKVLLLGAGGAARAIAFGLRDKGCEVMIVNRSREKAEILARELGFAFRSSLSPAEPDSEVLINATSVGMYPHAAASPVPKDLLRKGMTVMDIVYQPLRTKLLQEAEEQGCQTIDGLEMLARQGAAQLELWTGMRPDILEIKNDLRQALIRKSHSA
jgi:shikimate dehydrogenase